MKRRGLSMETWGILLIFKEWVEEELLVEIEIEFLEILEEN